MGSSKWNQMIEWNPNTAPGVIPFSVADMELKHPPELIEGLKSYLDEAILGYTAATPAYYEAVCGWMERRHSWKVDKDWIVFTPGIVNAFYEAINAFTEPGDGVMIMSPVYYPFYSAIEVNSRRVVDNPLILGDDGVYTIDFADFEAKAKEPNTKLLLLCSPHNPVCRVWKKEELEKIGRICNDNNVLVLADEIHFDFIMPGHKHTVYATISEEFEQNVILCTAPSKSFNLAGLQCSNIIIPSDKLRKAYQEQLQKSAMGRRLNIIAFKGCELAYTKCEEWFDELLGVIWDNFNAIADYCKNNLPKVKVTPLEGTYLMWLDFRAYGLSNDELEQIMHMDAEVFLDEGYLFGEAGGGFERINLAAPKSTLLAAMERVKKAMAKYE